MNSFETTATVEERGEVRVVGVPFAPGTEVEVAISAKGTGNEGHEHGTGRAERLLAALDKARNVKSIGVINREELYDREVLR